MTGPRRPGPAQPATGAWMPGQPAGERRFHTLDRPLALDGGATLHPVTMAYETWGRLNADRSNAVLVLHALTGDSHVVGSAGAGHPTPGWWDGLIGPGKGIENVIDAIATLNRRGHPVEYVVAGMTHPKVIAWQGEAVLGHYRALQDKLRGTADCPDYAALARALLREPLLLILDDVRCGFRLGPVGSHPKFGYEPDLAIYCKALARKASRSWPQKISPSTT